MLKEKYVSNTKVWKPARSYSPFYNGGKIEVDTRSNLLVTTFQDNICLSDWKNGKLLSKINQTSDEESDDLEDLTCFCINPKKSTKNENQMTVATKSGLIKLYNLDTKTYDKIIKAHNMPILCMTYDPSGTLVATGSADKTIKVWDIEKGHCTHLFTDHTDSIQRLYFHPDIHQLKLISTSDDNSIRLYDLRDSECISVFTQHMSLSTSVSIADNGYLMASSGRDKVLNFYELRTNTHIKTILILDIIESIVFLGKEHSRNILQYHNSIPSHTHSTSNIIITTTTTTIQDKKSVSKKNKSKDDHLHSSLSSSSTDVGIFADSYILLSAGEKGNIYMHAITMKGKEISTFQCHLLLTLPLYTTATPEIIISSYQTSKLMNLLKEKKLIKKMIQFHIQKIAPLMTPTESINDIFNNTQKSKKSNTSNILDIHKLWIDQFQMEPSVHVPVTSSIQSMQYIPEEHCIMVASTDHVIYKFDINTYQDHPSSTSTTQALSSPLPGPPLLLRSSYIGYHDDILDMKYIPSTTTSTTTTTTTISSHHKDTEDNKVEIPINSSSDKEYKDVMNIPYNLAVVTNSSQVRMINEKNECYATLYGHTDIVLALDISPDFKWIVTSSKDRNIRLWCTNTYQCTGIGQGHTDAVGSIVMSQNMSNYTNKHSFIISGGTDKILKKWELPCHNISQYRDYNIQQNEYSIFPPVHESPSSGDSSSSSHSSSSYNESINWVKEVNDFKLFLNYYSKSDYYTIIPTTTNTTTSTSTATATAAVVTVIDSEINIKAWREYYQLYYMHYPILILNLINLKSIKAHEKDITTIAISPNDTLIATGSQDKSIKLWDSETLTLVQTLNGHKRSVWKIVFSPIDKILVSSSGDRTVKLWSMNDYSCLRTFEGHTASVLNVQFINNALQLISSSADGLLRLWTLRTGECENTFDGHQDKIWCITAPQTNITQYIHSQIDSTTTTISTTTNDNDHLNDRKDDDKDDDDNHVDNGDDRQNRSKSDDIPTSILNQAPKFFFTGSSDSTIIQWMDVTKQEEEERLHSIEEEIVLEQEMKNDIYHKRYGKALSKALHLGHTNRLLTILKSILEDDRHSTTATTTNTTTAASTTISTGLIYNKLDVYIKKWNTEDLEKAILYIRDWNTNAKHSYVCTLLLDSIFSQHGIHKLMEIQHANVKECLPALISYSERHYQRISKLHESLYISEYILSLMTHFPSSTVQPSLMNSTQPGSTSAFSSVQVSSDQNTKLVNSKRKYISGVEDRINIIPDIFGNTDTSTTTTTSTKNRDHDNDNDDDNEEDKNVKKIKKNKNKTHVIEQESDITATSLTKKVKKQ